MNVPTFVRRRRDGTHHVDEWGLDPDVVALASPLVGLRWSVETQWPERIPAGGAAVLVHNRVLGISEPVVLARGVRQATGRPVRTAGLVDVAPFVGREVGRRWRLLVGPPVAHPSGGGPLAVADLVDAARAGVQALLDSAANPLAGFP
jgi:hypothetical protein